MSNLHNILFTIICTICLVHLLYCFVGIYRNIGAEKSIGPSNKFIIGLSTLNILTAVVDSLLLISEGNKAWIIWMLLILFELMHILIFAKFEKVEKKRMKMGQNI